MGNNPKMYIVILDVSISNYPCLMNDLIHKTTDARGNPFYRMICSEIDEGGNYFAAMVSVPNGETRKVLLRHSFVVAALESVNLQNPLGFVQEEFREE